MPRIPISIDLSMSDASITRLERHSYVNLINVVHAELQLIERMLDAPGSLRSAIHLAEAASRAFKEGRAARRHLHELVRFRRLIESDVRETLDEAGSAADEHDVREACSILYDVLPDAHLRVHEVIARHRLPWPEEELSKGEVVAAVEQRGVRVVTGRVGRTLRLPVGFLAAVAEMVTGADGQAQIEEVAIDQTDLTVVTVSGGAADGYLDPLGGRFRPSEIHSMLATRGEPLRGLIMIGYYTVPDGNAELATHDAGEFSLRAELARPAPIDEND